MKGKRLKEGDIVMMKARKYANDQNIVGALAIVVRSSRQLGTRMWEVKIGRKVFYPYRHELEHLGTVCD